MSSGKFLFEVVRSLNKIIFVIKNHSNLLLVGEVMQGFRNLFGLISKYASNYIERYCHRSQRS